MDMGTHGGAEYIREHNVTFNFGIMRFFSPGLTSAVEIFAIS